MHSSLLLLSIYKKKSFSREEAANLPSKAIDNQLHLFINF